MTEILHRPMQTLPFHRRDNVTVLQSERSPIHRGFSPTITPPRWHETPSPVPPSSGQTTPLLNSPQGFRTAQGFVELPRLERRSPNIPPSDEEKLAIVKAARSPVLSAADPEIQLNWAQDVFNYVDVSLEDKRRSAVDANKALQLTDVEQQLHMDARNIVLWLAGMQTLI